MKHVKGTGQHRAQPGRRRAAPRGKRRAEVRPRYGRIAVFSAAAVVTLVAVVGGFGLLPSGPENASAASGALRQSVVDSQQAHGRSEGESREKQAEERGKATSEKPGKKLRVVAATTVSRQNTDGRRTTALPADSGTGRRVVFSESEQRVWLVDDGEVLRSYLVSGSVYDNLEPGTYAVYSRSRWAVGIDDSGTMQYFVRFTQGDQGAAIGFHTIPVDDGEPVQTLGQLGTPLSHGCIRQRTPDAIALWDFAPIGTTVVVTA